MAAMRVSTVLVFAGVGALVAAAWLWPQTGGDDGGGVAPVVSGADPATTPGPGSSDPRIEVAPADGPPIDARIAVVRLVVRDDAEAPVAGCKVKVGEADAKLTAADGSAEFEVAPGRLWFDVEPADQAHIAVRQRLTAVGGRRLELGVALVRREIPEFYVRVVGADDHRPIAGARLHAQPSGEAEAVTDDQGVAQVLVGSDADHVRVAAPGRGPRRIVPTAGHGSPDQAVEVQLERAALLQLTVVDAEGHAVGDVDVSVTAMAFSLRWPADGPVRGGPELWTARGDADGVSAFADLPANCPLFVTATPPPGTAAPGTETFSLLPGTNQRHLTLQPLGELHGRVLDAGGRPVGGAQVVAVAGRGDEQLDLLPSGARGDSVRSEADGSYRLPGLAPGVWSLGLQGTEGWSSACRRVEVPAGGSVQADVLAVPALAISGRLLGPGNEPISAFEVFAMRRGVVVATGITEKDGSYRLEPLPAGEFDVFTELYQSELAMVAPVRAVAGRSGVDIKVALVLGAVRGRVIAGRGGELWLRGLRRDGEEFCGGRCDADGRFEQSRLRSGRWDLIATDARGNVGVLHGVEVVAGRTTADLELALKPGAVVRPAHRDADAFRIENGTDVAARDGLERGLPGEAMVPPGTWTVVFLRGGFEIARQQVTVAAGAQELVAPQ